ncbi:MTR2 (YKL186C) [Zygosaccharomyces parabailii]|nr:MTR2 (YKL186C) [Zygosaccharomyces parabailii]
MNRYGGRAGNFGNSGSNSGSSNSRSQIAELFVKKVLTHLDDTDPSKLHQFLGLFNPNGCKVIINATPFAQPTLFLEQWETGVTQTQHALTAVDYHVIPGSNSVVFNVNCKVRFDEGGRDRAGQDASIQQQPQHSQQQPQHSQQPRNALNRTRPLWGSYFGVSLQMVVEERVLSNDTSGTILAFNYNMVYKPDDSLMKIH